MPPPLTRFLQALRPPHRLRHVYERLLGTEVELQVIAVSQGVAEAAEGAGLDELDRLVAIFNRFDPGSELRRWLTRPDERVFLSADLWRVLELTDHWRKLSGGAFHAGADALGELWQAAAREERLPSAEGLAGAVASLQPDPWTLHLDGSATLHARYTLGLNALAKGYVVDRVAETIAAHDGVSQVLVNAGGDLRTLGGRGLKVAVADPSTTRDDAPPVAWVWVRDGALASSGNAHRGQLIGEQWYSHVLDPRSGQPVAHVQGVTVTAPDCATADALATVLGMLDIPAGLALIDTRPGCAALIIGSDGQRHVSRGWNPLTST